MDELYGYIVNFLMTARRMLDVDKDVAIGMWLAAISTQRRKEGKESKGTAIPARLIIAPITLLKQLNAEARRRRGTEILRLPFK